MRVLQLGPYPPPHGGVQTNLVALRRFLLERRIPCPVINLTRFRKPPDDHQVYYPKNALQLLWLLLRLRYDIIHLHIGGNLTWRLLGLSLICGLIPWAKAVLTFHSGGYSSSRHGTTACPSSLRGFVFRRFDRLIAVNPEIAGLFLRFGVSPRRTRLICPYSFSARETLQNRPLPHQLNDFYQSHSPVFVTVALLEPEYDLPLQIEVLESVRRRFPNAGLAIIGSGSLETELRSQISAKSFAEHIFLSGDLSHDDALHAIASADLFLRTTLFDGDSISLREAIQLGTPVIATNNQMRPPQVHLIPPSDLAALRRAIEDRLASPAPPSPAPEPDTRNLDAVLATYQELTA